MQWLAANWFWAFVLGAFVWMHLSGHGCHAGHGSHHGGRPQGDGDVPHDSDATHDGRAPSSRERAPLSEERNGRQNIDRRQ